jgi:hypothetical protein
MRVSDHLLRRARILLPPIAGLISLAFGAVGCASTSYVTVTVTNTVTASASPATTTTPNSQTTSPISTPTSPSPPSSHSPAPAVTTEPPPGPTPRHASLLVFPSDGTAFDLDSTASSWTPSKGVAWNNVQDIEYVSDFNNEGYPGFLFSGSPWTVAILPKGAVQDYSSCVTANYGGNGSAKTIANYPAGAAIQRGRAVCVHTPADRIALLQFKSVPGATVSVYVTVWSKH